MQADDASQQKFKDVATRGFGDRMALTERGLVAGGVLLAKMGDEGLCINGEKERILTLLSIAHRCAVPPAVFGFLRRASKPLRACSSLRAAWESSTRKARTASRWRLSSSRQGSRRASLRESWG